MILCETELNHKQVKAFSQRIDEDYTLHMLADNLPAATVFKNLKSGELQYEDGFKLGFSYTSHVVINNHLKIRIKYHAVPNVCNVWNVVSSQSRSSNDSRHCSLHVHGSGCRLPRCQTLQDPERLRLEEGSSSDCHSLSLH
ncbi:Transmembrane 9 superfamily member 7, partial [Geodia barretti]